MAREPDQQISEVVKREQSRLWNFIRRRVPDPRDAEDILQDVFYELVEANRLLMPIDHITGWLFRVARNRIVDLFRKKTPQSFSDATAAREGDELTATASELWRSGRSGLYQVDVTNQKGERIALFRGRSQRIPGHLLDEGPGATT